MYGLGGREKWKSDEKIVGLERNGVHNCTHEQNRIGLNSEIQHWFGRRLKLKCQQSLKETKTRNLVYHLLF